MTVQYTPVKSKVWNSALYQHSAASSAQYALPIIQFHNGIIGNGFDTKLTDNQINFGVTIDIK